MSARAAIVELQSRMAKDIVGQERVLERIVIGLLANGNLLVEGLPGLAKTRAIKSLSKHLDAGLSRIQFTPDLLPSDITGSEVYYSADGKGEFKFEPGPIFNKNGSDLSARLKDALGPPCTSRCSRLHVERDHVTPEDVRAVAHDTLRHRIMSSYTADAGGVSTDRVVDAIVEQVAIA